MGSNHINDQGPITSLINSGWLQDQKRACSTLNTINI